MTNISKESVVDADFASDAELQTAIAEHISNMYHLPHTITTDIHNKFLMATPNGYEFSDAPISQPSAKVTVGSDSLIIDDIKMKSNNINIQSLIDLGGNTFKDADGVFRTVTTENLIQIKLEMQADGLKKYQMKWYYENLINSATSINDIKDLLISF